MKTNILTILFGSLLFGCSKQQQDFTTPNNPHENVTKTFLIKTTTQPQDILTNINGYAVQGGIFYKSFKDIEYREEGFSLDVPRNAHLFLSSNIEEPMSMEALNPGQTTLTHLMAMTTDADAVHSPTQAPEFFSGVYVPNIESEQQQIHSIEMVRSTARLDFDMTRDQKIKVDRIVVSGASQTTRIFEGTAPWSSDQKVEYQCSYNPALADVATDQFRLYESNTPIQVTVYGTYNQIPTVVKVAIPQILRNHIYRIKISNAGNTINGSFNVMPWQTGDDIEANPGLSAITMDAQNSIFPSDIAVDYVKNIISVPDQGGEFTVAFRSETSLTVSSVEGQHADFQYTPAGVESVEGGLITKFDVRIAPQANGKLAYTVKLNLQNDLLQNSYDQVVFNVAQSANQIPTVTLGGITWMAFNATTPRLEDQLYTLDGMTVHQAYHEHWLDYIGGLFQWGRKYKYTPWLSGATDAGSQSQNSPWVADTHMPCPDGFRVPTEMELRKLLPNRLAIPGSYDYNEELITVAIHSAQNPNVSISGVTGTARYITLTSTTGQVMYIPLAGQKDDKSWATSPGFGASFCLWASEVATVGGHAWVAEFSPGAAVSGNVADRKQIPAEAYAYLRCIKK